MLREFLQPNWRKVLACVALAVIAVGAQIQTWAFSEIGPKPLLYDLLSPFPLWPLWIYLILTPLDVLSSPLKLVGFNIISGPYWAFAAASGIYCYLLSCLLVVSFDRYAKRFPRWLWGSMVVVPLLFLIPELSTLVTSGNMARRVFDFLVVFLPLCLVGSLCLYLVACLGCFSYEMMKMRRGGGGRPRPSPLAPRPLR